ncbi:MAG TPA: 4-aminobutyrate--2-oxoglutarate transaminase [Actinomycetota bacterium]|jgi:4-aminobutyrate aminotransferase/(S)-3-amino-2-methylpropionate transaminase|nr:4-aminobutyrate--2-oxoglutarate transaminase [Actinomycetota bacterium]
MDIPQERKLVTDIPGPRSKQLLARRQASVPKAVFTTVPLFVRAASGAILEDVDGNRLIDLGAGIAVLNVGNASPAVVEAATSQTELFTHTCFHVTMHEPYVDLAERLNALTPGDHEKQTMLVNSGAEAVENAVKIARYATGRSAVVTFDHAFHGRTLLTMSLTGKVMPYKHGFGPFAPEIYRLPYAYPYRCPAGQPPESCGPACVAHAIDEMERHIGPESIAAIVVEPVQGEGGFIVPAPEFLPALKEFCERHGIVFVADEVQTGFGRTGAWFAVEHLGIVPDLVTTAKSMGGGFPIGAVTGRRELMDAIHVGGLGGTFGGNPVSCAAALAAIDQIEREELLGRAARIGETMTARLQEFRDRFGLVGDVRGLGAMVAMELVTDRATKAPAKDAAARIIEECYKQGVVVLKAGTYDNVIRLLPPLTIDEGLLDEGLGILEKALASASG